MDQEGTLFGRLAYFQINAGLSSHFRDAVYLVLIMANMQQIIVRAVAVADREIIIKANMYQVVAMANMQLAIAEVSMERRNISIEEAHLKFAVKGLLLEFRLVEPGVDYTQLKCAWLLSVVGAR